MIEFLRGALEAERIAIDTETTGLDIQDGRDYLMGISMAYERNSTARAMYFPFRHVSDNIEDPRIFKMVKWVIEHAKVIIFHHAKFDIPSLATIGIGVPGKFYCTMILAHLISETWPRSKSLDEVCKAYKVPGKEKSVVLQAWIEIFGWAAVPGRYMAAYAANDAIILLPLFDKIYPRYLKELKGNGEKLWEHKQDFIRLLIKMKDRGVRVDVDKCKFYVERADKTMAQIEQKLGFKPTPTNIGNYFINKLGLPVIKYTELGKPSFTAAILDEYEQMLEEMGDQNETVQDILAYRGWQKARSAFYQSWLDHLSSDGRLRPNYIMHKEADSKGNSLGGTVTGRLSCREPNLQQIPRVTTKEWNKEVKSCLIAEDGWSLIEGDYSQLELRLSTAYANEKRLIKVFNEDRDIFTEMSQDLGLTRDQTKTFVYSTQYGAGDERISTVFKVSKAKAKAMRQNYFDQYPGFHILSLKSAEAVHRTHRIRIWTGRFRHFRNPEEEAHKAMNACIQGGAADIVEHIMVKLANSVDNEDECRILLTVHDSVIFEIRNDKIEEYVPKIKAIMEAVNEIADFGIKFAVDMHYLGKKESLT